MGEAQRRRKLAQTHAVRLVLRVEDNQYVAYCAAPDTMEGAVRLGSIAMGAITTSPARKVSFQAMMEDLVSDLLEETIGQRPTWPDGPKPAPAREDTGQPAPSETPLQALKGKPSIAASWIAYRALVLHPQAPDAQVADHFLAFWAGASALFYGLIGNVSDDEETTPAEETMMQGINDEIEAFTKTFDAEVLKRHGGLQ